jgi:hypothetical protein
MADVADVVVVAVYERAAGALAGAIRDLEQLGDSRERVTAILLKRLLAHFDGLDAEIRDLLAPELDRRLAEAVAEASGSPRPRPVE